MDDDPFAGRVRYEEFGLESVLRSHNPYIKTKPDIVLIWLHYICLRNLMKSHGGEGMTTEFRTEHLPRNLAWNGLIQRYLIKYEFQYATYILGIYIRKGEADCSLVTLEKSLRIGIPINDLVRNDLTIVDSVVDTFTDIVERNFIQPMISSSGALGNPLFSPVGTDDVMRNSRNREAQTENLRPDASLDDTGGDDDGNGALDREGGLANVGLEYALPSRQQPYYSDFV